MLVKPLPSGFITKRSPVRPPKMIFVPSGDHAEVSAWISVSLVGLEPSALTTQRCSVSQPPKKQSVALAKVIFDPSGDHAGFQSASQFKSGGCVIRVRLLPSTSIRYIPLTANFKPSGDHASVSKLEATARCSLPSAFITKISTSGLLILYLANAIFVPSGDQVGE